MMLWRSTTGSAAGPHPFDDMLRMDRQATSPSVRLAALPQARERN